MLRFFTSRVALAPYQPLFTPTSSWRRLLTENWLKLALGLAVVLNIIQALAKIERPVTPLDNYQILKPALAAAVPSSSVPSTSPRQRAVVTTLYNDAYTIPVAVLGHSLAAVNATARRIVLVMPDRLSQRALCIARAAGWEPHEVALIPPPRGGKGVFSHFVDTFTKLRMWQLDKSGIERVVYLDADTLVRQNFDELFELPFPFAASPDAYDKGDPRGFPVSINSGVLALHTSSATFDQMMRALPVADFPLLQADQAFLNLYFGAEINRLPYAYNGNLAIKRRSPALWEALRPSLKIVHYTWPTPFTKEAGAGLQSKQQTMTAVELAQRERNGLHRDEVGWWVEAWREFQAEKRVELLRCERL